MEKRIPLPNRVNPISFDVFFAKNPLKSPKVSKYQVGREERAKEKRRQRMTGKVGRGEDRHVEKMEGLSRIDFVI